MYEVTVQTDFRKEFYKGWGQHILTLSPINMAHLIRLTFEMLISTEV